MRCDGCGSYQCNGARSSVDRISNSGRSAQSAAQPISRFTPCPVVLWKRNEEGLVFEGLYGWLGAITFPPETPAFIDTLGLIGM